MLLAESLERVKLLSLHVTNGRWEAEVEPVSELGGDSEESQALAKSLRKLLTELANDANVKGILGQTDAPGLLADRVASFIEMTHAKYQPPSFAET